MHRHFYISNFRKGCLQMINCKHLKSNAVKQSRTKNGDTLKAGKKWCVAFLGAVWLGIVSLGLYNYVVDPYQYFKNSFDNNLKWGYSQYYKVNYILKHPDEYNSFIIGGSNSGVLDPELIDRYNDGYNTYSLCFARGNWYNYYDYTKFLIDNTDVKQIILHLSSGEFKYSRESVVSDYGGKVPAIATNDGLGILKELKTFLTKAVGDNPLYDKTITVSENGKLDWSMNVDLYNENPDDYVKTYVFSGYLGSRDLKMYGIDECIQLFEEIKELCDENDVKLIVINGACFTSKRYYKFECNQYYDYLERLTDITDIWDFSGITAINANPYNFFDNSHYNYEIANAEIKFIFDDLEIDQEFGVHLTKDNILDYLYDRKLKFNQMLEELDETGTISYGDYDDPSRLTGEMSE